MPAVLRTLILVLLVPAGLLACAAPPTMSQAPSEQAQARIQPGMTVPQVEELLGRPDGGTSVFGEETVSGWRVPVRGHGIRAAYFNVHYRGGKVVRTSRSAEYVGG